MVDSPGECCASCWGLDLVVLASRLVAPASEWIARAPTSVQQLIDSYERLRRSVPFLAPPEIALRPTVTTKGRPAAEIVPAAAAPASDPVKGQNRDRRHCAYRFFDQAGDVGHRVDRCDDYFVVLLSRFRALADGTHSRGNSQAPRPCCCNRRLSRGAARHRALSWNAGNDQCRRRHCDRIGANGDRLSEPDPMGRNHCSAWLHSLSWARFFSSCCCCLPGRSRTRRLARSLRRPPCTPLINVLESNFIAPWIVGRRLEMSPLFVFLAVMVCAWMWGVAGAFLAVPLLVIIRSAARRSKSLRLWCVYLDRGRPELPTMRTLLGIGLRRRRRRVTRNGHDPGVRQRAEPAPRKWSKTVSQTRLMVHRGPAHAMDLWCHLADTQRVESFARRVALYGAEHPGHTSCCGIKND